jgi:hypothetical protein
MEEAMSRTGEQDDAEALTARPPIRPPARRVIHRGYTAR